MHAYKLGGLWRRKHCGDVGLRASERAFWTVKRLNETGEPYEGILRMESK
jgi:hypothetical protein